MHFLLCLLSIIFLTSPSIGSEVISPPISEIERLGLDPFYKKYLSVSGFPIVASENVSDYALKEAAFLIEKMIGHREDVLQALVKEKVRLAIMATDEFTTAIPEHSHLKPKDYWDKRARGLGSSKKYPAVSCGEENLLGYKGDPYAAENILIHEFGHSIHHGLKIIDPGFQGKLEKVFNRAALKGLWKGKYAGTNPSEYWAEAVQSWFDTNRQNDYEHNHVNTREELKKHDPELAALIKSVFGDGEWRYQRPPERDSNPHLTGYDPARNPVVFSWPEKLSKAYAAIQSGKNLKRVQSFPLEKLEGIKSTTVSKKNVPLRFDNRSKQRVSLFWIDFKGDRHPYGSVDPGRNSTQQTFAGHVWLVIGESEAPITLCICPNAPGLLVID